MHAHRETTGPVRRASIEPIDAASAMPAQASATGLGGFCGVRLARWAQLMPLIRLGARDSHVVCSTLRFFEQYLITESEKAVTRYDQFLEYKARIPF